MYGKSTAHFDRWALRLWYWATFGKASYGSMNSFHHGKGRVINPHYPSALPQYVPLLLYLK